MRKRFVCKGFFSALGKGRGVALVNYRTKGKVKKPFFKNSIKGFKRLKKKRLVRATKKFSFFKRYYKYGFIYKKYSKKRTFFKGFVRGFYYRKKFGLFLRSDKHFQGLWYFILIGRRKPRILWRKVLNKRQRRWKYKRKNSFIFRKKFLNYKKYYYLQKYRLLLFKSLAKPRRLPKFTFVYVISKINSVYKKYFKFLRFLNLQSFVGIFYKKIIFLYVFKKIFFFKRQKKILTFLKFKKYVKQSFLSVYLKLNYRLYSFLYNLNLRNINDLLIQKVVYVNGRIASFKNIKLQSKDLVFLKNYKNTKIKYNNLLPFELLYLEGDELGGFKSDLREAQYTHFRKKYNLYFFSNSILIGDFPKFGSFLKKSIGPKDFYLKIFSKKLKFTKRSPLRFQEICLRKNKYFKIKYLLKKKKIRKIVLKRIFKKIKRLDMFINMDTKHKYFLAASKRSVKIKQTLLFPYVTNEFIKREGASYLYRYLQKLLK